jgi:hypothetical protein
MGDLVRDVSAKRLGPAAWPALAAHGLVRRVADHLLEHPERRDGALVPGSRVFVAVQDQVVIGMIERCGPSDHSKEPGDAKSPRRTPWSAG